jgi:prepilin-type N-terminal cleavage/methylation domain-containing protein
MKRNYSESLNYNERRNDRQRGFSLIEIMMVVACIGVISAIALPKMNQAMAEARKSAAIHNLREIATSQHDYHLRYKRYGRLDELNTFEKGKFGTLSGTTLEKSRYTFQMIPASPTDLQLDAMFTVTATFVEPDGTTIQFLTDQDGGMTQTLP